MNACSHNLSSFINNKMYLLKSINLNNNTKIYDLDKKDCSNHDELEIPKIQNLKFSPIKNNLLAYNQNNDLNLVFVHENTQINSNNQNFEIEKCLYFKDHLYEINCINWSENSQFICSGGNDGMINLYDLVNQKLSRTFIQEETKSAITCLDTIFSNNLIVAGLYDKQIILYDVRTAKSAYRILAHSEPITSINLSEDGRNFISTSYDGFIRIWNLFKGTCQKTISLEKSPPIGKSIYLPDQDFIIVSSLNNEISLLNLITEEIIFKYKDHKNQNYLIDFEILALSKNNDFKKRKKHYNDDEIMTNSYFNKKNFIYYESDETFIVSGSEDGKLYIWDISNINNRYCISQKTSSNSLTNSIIQTLSVNSDSDKVAFIILEENEVKRNNSMEKSVKENNISLLSIKNNSE